MQIMKRFVPSYWLLKWLWYRVYNLKVVSSSPRVCFLYLYLIRLILFIVDVPRPLRNEILDHSFSKERLIIRKMSQSVANISRDSRENIFSCYSQNIRLKIIHYTCCVNWSSEEISAASIGTKAKQIFFTLKICQQHIYSRIIDGLGLIRLLFSDSQNAAFELLVWCMLVGEPKSRIVQKHTFLHPKGIRLEFCIPIV